MNARNQVVDRLLEGELTLIQAAAWFRYLNENPPRLASDYRGQWPGDSDGEKLCRVIDPDKPGVCLDGGTCPLDAP